MSAILPPRGYKKQDTEKRKEWLENKTGFHLNETGPDNPEDFKGIIENHVGFMHLPLAIAGPLLISGTYAKGEFYIPVCTLEGTLTMSMTRGLFLTHLSGGIKTNHIKQELSRSPIFIFKDIDQSKPFSAWIQDHFEEIKKAAESTTNHGKLLRIDKYPSQNSVILDFVYDTGEASGQNMVTIATHKACKFISENCKSTSGFKYYIESNFNGDKNPAYKSLLLGRSHYVVGSALIEGRFLRRILRVTAKEYVDGWIQCTRGSQEAGIFGMNMHVANALTSIYLATGQDAASVVENAGGMISYEIRNTDDLFATITMPSITVGTVGGGTRLKQARKNLELLGCTGKNSSKKLAEIVCACALALELSLGGAIVSDEFAFSHAKYGRK
ncbi:MAG TPA: hydroxymethylglutaryl-CoA reductase [Ignavibacteriaceae bacterium]|nr:hydroxymethylglutaryl-CoA reductase [Ignavibacteriaceae bacterium]